jgi:hypothetical protein
LAKAKSGWRFLTNAISRFGFDGAYQKIQHFDDEFTHRDELSWAACELYLATGDPQYQANLLAWFPDPTDVSTFRFGWQRMFACYGNAIRDYAFAVSSGRLSAGQINPGYLAKCINVITNSGNDVLSWSQDNAYGTSFPDITKAYRGAGWYFGSEQAFEMVVAYQINPNPLYIDALLRNMNFEAGCNPVNVTYLSGVGWKRPRNIVDQYSLNDTRTLPKDGVLISNITPAFQPVWVYGWELLGLMYPADSIDTAPYPYYDRWCDDWNVSTEGSTTDTARSFAATAWLAAQTSPANQPWRWTNAIIIAPTTARLPGQPLTVSLSVADPNLSTARITWEANGQEPSFGGLNYTFTPPTQFVYWIEAEVQWPDGRRAFATNFITISTNAPPQLSTPQKIAGSFSFILAGTPFGRYAVQVSTNLSSWLPMVTNTLPANGIATITDPQSSSFSGRYYRAMRVP